MKETFVNLHMHCDFNDPCLFRRHTNIQKNYLQYSYRIMKKQLKNLWRQG